MTQHFKYPECQKGAHHIGQTLNLVCMQPKCIQKSIICGICYDDEHKGHKIRPLKVVINTSRKYLEHLTPMTIDTQEVKKQIAEARAKLISRYDIFQNYVNENLRNMRSSIDAIFIKVADQIQLKTGKNDELLKALEDIKSNEMQYETFVALMQKLLAGVPMDYDENGQEADEGELSGKQIEDTITRLKTKLEKQLQQKETKVKQQLSSFMSTLQSTADNPSIFDAKIQFKFSPELKHTGVTVVSDNLIKSGQGYNYHFALMEPSIQEKGNRPFTVAFCIKENISNWLAVGICYKNVIQANSYAFNYSTVGHGAYLVSSNGGSWCSNDASKNNTVTAFSYAKGDVVTVEYQPEACQAVFRKKGTEEVYTIAYEVKEDDELCLCGLFYYNNDEIEFMGYDQE